MTKACSQCGQKKPLTAFTKRSRESSTAKAICLACGALNRKQNRDNEGDAFREKRKGYYANNPEAREKRKQRCKAWREGQRVQGSLSHMYRWHNYGLTEQAYTELCVKDPVCAICGVANKPLVVDHDHQTEKVRGRLCSKCNTSLGGFGDSPVLLNRAVQYLEARC